MADLTTHYGLVKPTPEDFYNIEVSNGNMDKIDAELKAGADRLASEINSHDSAEDAHQHLQEQITRCNATAQQAKEDVGYQVSRLESSIQAVRHQINQRFTDGVPKVKSSNGVTLDDKGLNVSTSGGRVNTKVDGTEVKITQVGSGKELLRVRDTGVNVGGALTIGGKPLADLIYPIGSVYMSVNNTNPGTLFGGTWEKIVGKFLYCDSTSKQTGGAKTVNLSHTHTTADHTLTVNQIPSHNHTDADSIRWNKPNGNADIMFPGQDVGSGAHGGGTKYTGNTGGGQPHNHGNTGSALGNSVSIMPPYYTVHCWYRTA